MGGAPTTFDIRGFTFSQVNVLYNGISIGPQDITSRVMETANLEQVEFLKGPSSLMTGLNAIGGSVNFVSRQPTTGAIKSELDTSIDTLGTYRTHFGSGGSTTLPGRVYRFDASSSKVNSFIDGDYHQLNNVSGQLNYHVNDSFWRLTAFAAREQVHFSLLACANVTKPTRSGQKPISEENGIKIVCSERQLPRSRSRPGLRHAPSW